MAMGGTAPTNAVTDRWVTASPKADATDPQTLPRAVADSMDIEDDTPALDPNDDASSIAMGGMAPTNAVTDEWVTASPKADATDPTTLPGALADALDGTDHSGDAPTPDGGGQVFDESVAAANRRSAQ
ncbi:MAG TPA: hypothetical protein VM142_03985 [Acidimicrobiales bacterium]|nr:hypothetical protein [Acidimicrobiales bacterium]